MTDSMLDRASWPTPPTTIPEWQGVERAIARMSPEEAMRQLAHVNGLLSQQRRSLVTDELMASVQELDRPVLRPTSEERRSPSQDRGRASFPTSPQRSPGALDLLISARRVGPRLAARMVQASARIETARRNARRHR